MSTEAANGGFLEKKKKLKSPDVTWYQNPWKIDMKKISFN